MVSKYISQVCLSLGSKLYKHDSSQKHRRFLGLTQTEMNPQSQAAVKHGTGTVMDVYVTQAGRCQADCRLLVCLVNQGLHAVPITSCGQRMPCCRETGASPVNLYLSYIHVQSVHILSGNNFYDLSQHYAQLNLKNLSVSTKHL